MGVLRWKLVRELFQLKGQVLAIALVIAGGVAVCVMSVVNYSSLSETRARYYDSHRFADVFVELKRAPLHIVDRIRKIPGVTAVHPRVTGIAALDMPGNAEPVSAGLFSIPPEGQPSVNQLFVKRGRLPTGEDLSEVAIIGSFASAHKLGPGDQFEATINGRKTELKVVGVVESPEFIYVIPPGAMLPDYERYGVLWLSRAALSASLNLKRSFNSLTVRVRPGVPVADVIDRIDRVVRPYGGTGAYARQDQFSHRFLSDELAQLKTMAVVFPVMFMGVAMFLLHMVMARLISTQRDVIAVLKAFGYSNGMIGWHYSQLVLMIAFFGVLLGVLSGLWLGAELAEMYMEYYRFPELLLQTRPGAIALVALLTAVTAWIGAWRSIRRASELPPAEAMRPEAPARFRRTGVERLLVRLFSSPTSKLMIRQILRNPLKTVLSMIGVGFATAIVVVGNFQFDSVSLMIHAQFARAQQEDVRVTLTDPTEISAVHAFSTIQGVRHVEGVRVVPVRLRHEHRTERISLNGLPENSRLTFILDEALNTVSIPEDGLLLTDFLAEKLNVGVGDRIQVAVLDGKRARVTLKVTGISSEFLGMGAYMRLEALNRNLGEGDLINQVLIAHDGLSSESIYRELRGWPKVASLSVRQAMLDSFNDTLARTFLTFTFFNAILGALIALGVIYNTVRISLAERSRELASLRVLGYTRSEVAHVLLGEIVLLMSLGIPLGWLIGQGMALGLVSALQTELYRVPLVMTSQTLAIAAAVVIASGLVSGWIAWRRLGNMDLVGVLKTRE